MADKHSLNYEVRELKLGASFTNNKQSQYHTIKYDFKPASVDVNKVATVDVSTTNQVTVTVPHLDGAGTPQTVFKGNQRPYTKECVLIIDRVTGEITLEKLSSNIQVKKTRQEQKRPVTPVTSVTADVTNTTQRSTSRTRVATNRRPTTAVPGHLSNGPVNSSQPRFNGTGGQQKTPPNMVRSPQRVKTSPPQAAPWSGGNSTLASLPMIGFDDGPGLGAPSPPAAPPPQPAPPPAPAPPAPVHAHNGYGPGRGADRQYAHDRNPHPIDRGHQSAHATTAPVVQGQGVSLTAGESGRTDSSSSSSSDSDSDSGSDSDDDVPPQPHVPPLTNGNVMNPVLPRDVLTDDLCLSESGSESD